MLYRLPIAAACAVAFTVALPNAANHRFITETDLYKFTWIADPQISPDGSAVAFVRVVALYGADQRIGIAATADGGHSGRQSALVAGRKEDRVHPDARESTERFRESIDRSRPIGRFRQCQAAIEPGVSPADGRR